MSCPIDPCAVKRLAIAVLLVVAAGCDARPDRQHPVGEQPAIGADREAPAQTGTALPPPAPPPPPDPFVRQVASLAGEWRVAGIDGEPLDEPYGIALSADEEEIWWEPRCFGLVRGYTVSGMRLTIRAPAASGPPPGALAPPNPVCALAPPPRVADVRRALDAATRIERTPENGVLISGGGHSLLLFSQ